MLRKPFKEADFHLNLHRWSKDVILDSGERDVAYCVNPGRNLASKKPDGDQWAKLILLDLWTNVHIPFGSKFELVLEHDVL